MSRTRRLSLSLAATVVLTAVQFGAGLVAHSTGLVADAGHDLTDVAALVLALVAVRLALRPPSPARSFGNHRATILAALANAALLAVVTVLIVVASVHRLLQPEPARAGIMVAVAALAVVVNTAAALLLWDGTAELNLRSVLLHLVGDALASGAVLVAGVVLLVAPGATWLDPASAIVVALLIVVQTVGVIRDSVSVLLESTPPDVDLDRLRATMGAVDGVSEVHDLHVWSLSSEVRLLSAHVVVTGHPDLEAAQQVGNRVRAAIGVPFAIAHSTLELECERCDDVNADPCGMDAVGRSVDGPLHRH